MKLNNLPIGLQLIMVVGAICIVVFAFLLLWMIAAGCKELIYKMIYRYKYKHRFDKPPTAKCYCKDCKWHNVETNRCANVTWADRHTPDNGFCYEAKPKGRDDDAEQ